MLSPISGVGEAFFPRIISLILLFLVGFYVWKVFKNKLTTTKEKDDFAKEAIKRQLLFGVLLILCVILIKIAGMLIVLGLFMIAALHYLENISWFKSIVLSVVTMIGLFLLFVQWLNVRLPSGIFF